MIVVASARSARSTAHAKLDRRRSDARTHSRTAPRHARTRARAGVATCSSNASVSPATGRKWKIPPPSLLSSTIVSASPSRRAASRPPMSCASATSPISSTTGPSPAAAAPNAVETVPSIPFAPRFASTRGAVVARGDELLDVADRHRGGDEQRRVGRQPLGELARPPAARTAHCRARRVIAAAARASAPRHDASQPSSTAASAAGRRAASGRGRRSAARRPRRGPARRRRGRSRSAPRRGPPATRAAASRSADRRRGARTGAGGRTRSPRRAAAGRSARSRPARGGRRTAGRPAAGSRRGQRTRPAARASFAVALVAPGDDHHASERVRAARRQTCAGAVRTSTYGPLVVTAASRPRAAARSSTSGSRSGKFRCTGPGGPSTAVQ